MRRLSATERTPFGWVDVPPRSNRRLALWVAVPMAVAGLVCAGLAVWLW